MTKATTLNGKFKGRMAVEETAPTAAVMVRMEEETVLTGASVVAGSETVSMAFAKVDLEYKPQKPDGSLDAGIHFKFDIKANKEG